MNNKFSITSLMSSFARAYHSENNINPIFTDTIARKLITNEEYEMIKKYLINGISFFAPDIKFNCDESILKYIVDTQLAPTPLARAKYCENCLKTAIKTGTTQYVILGAGMDTFCWREKELLNKITVFEIDHPKTQADKIKRLKNAHLSVPKNLQFIPMDFTCDDLKEKLLNSNFDVNQKTFFSYLGVSYYLTADVISKLFENISSFAAEGSTLLFDYPDNDLFNAKEKRVQNMLAMAKAGGEPMIFSSNELDLTVLLDKYSFLVYEHLTPQDININYFNNRTDSMTAFEHINYVTAVLKNTPFINTKEKIMQVSLKLFSTRGYNAVSIQDIANQLSITKAAIYKHYASKLDILNYIVNSMEKNCKNQDFNNYNILKIKDLNSMMKKELIYWTKNPLACQYRKLLTIERFSNKELNKLYNQHFLTGKLLYISSIFKKNKIKKNTLEYYSPILYLYNLFDNNEGENIIKLFDTHIKKQK